jgi:ABC-type antimicrobial peptide transport system permease subunit
MTGGGIAVGMVGGLILARFLASLVFGVSLSDAVTFLTAPVALIVVAGLAAFGPARRAARMDPMRALRE